MILWRISAFSDLSGRGGFLVGGRWHTVGNPVVYMAGTPSGALLEVLVHMEVDQEDFPENLQLLRVDLPNEASVLPAVVLQPGWQSAPDVTRSIGDDFLRSNAALLLPVPSAVMPHTMNYLFNPLHPDAGSATVTAELFSLDSRLIKH
ncbi:MULTISPECIES: RES family NAD+ phosphorylase [Pseudomonas]|uniref:RES family NAD+ phosphorylase n=1 Tax=Pseudomonas quercus TaxID=2722792 RepID=A0ABX0YGJ7_9PSED|nr:MULTISPECIES: RES family NAD+ phosphorylase [Pseudomonas]MBF7142605.1 RES family NAD+ phosphorylase [Pseudomonas sp. LY10J]NJP01143.1 RES family NAD+ phosphorylase [Pseudomonas quercus]